MMSFTVSTTAKIEFGLDNQFYIIRKLRVACFIAGTANLPLHSEPEAASNRSKRQSLLKPQIT